jgi:transposase
MTEYYLVAVDVSKDTLHIQTDDQAYVVANDRGGLRKLMQRLAQLRDPLVVLEATGGYERPLLEALREAKIGSRMVNPARIRAFATSEGIKAKTDSIDGKVILRFAKEKKLQPAAPLSAEQRELIDLLDRRSQLSEQLAREKNRLQKASKTTAAFIRRMIGYIERQIQSVERAIKLQLAADPQLEARARALLTVQGVGQVTAWTVLAYLSEITTLERNRLVALAGIAPFNRDSGNTSAKRSIFGGRGKVRRCLYMAAHTAAIHNPVIRDYVQRLRARGKAYKSALVAAMRKLLIHLQSVLRKSSLLPLAH